jgi:hypothetical protein
MKHAQQSFTTVNSPNPPTKKVQVAQVSDASAESAPFIYFDGVLTAGVHQGNVRLELGASSAIPTQNGEAKTVHVITAHLRCSPSAAAALRDAIDKALLLLAPAKGQSS